MRGFRHAASNQAISHTLKNRGNARVEGRRGQLAVEPADFGRLPEIVRRGSYGRPEPHKSPNPRIVITAEIDGVGYHYVAEARAGKKRPDILSLRKKRGSWQVAALSCPACAVLIS